MCDLAAILSLLETEDTFLLTTHLHPDGDGLGSMFALGRALEKRGKRPIMILTEGVPTSYGFLSGSGAVIRQIPDGHPSATLIALDCADRDRMGLPVPDQALNIINIDHHLSNNRYGQYNLVDPEASATGELVHRLLAAGGYPLDREIAAALYVAIATDTGFFRYTNATRGAFSLAASLVEKFQLEPGKIAEVVHEQKSLNAVKLLGAVLGTLQLSHDGTVAWMYLSHEMLAQYPVELEETEGFINYARSILGVEIALCFKEARPHEVRVSWRSGSAADVSQLAAYFGGGGHARAAGCTIQARLEEAIERVLNFLAAWREGKLD